MIIFSMQKLQTEKNAKNRIFYEFLMKQGEREKIIKKKNVY